MAYGISSAAGIFQCTLESLLQGIASMMVYIDEILISGRSEEEHLQLLEKVLDHLQTAGLHLKRENCVFMAELEEYLRTG